MAEELILKAVLIAVVVLVAFAAGGPVLAKGGVRADHPSLGWGEAFAAGIFLGAGLIHMLGDADGGFTQAGASYPYAPMICGAVVLALLWLEHLGNQLATAGGGGGKDENKAVVPIMAAVMLSVHSFLTGAAFGVTSSIAVTIVIFLAVLAHKGAASFALALELTRGGFSRGRVWLIFAIFVAMFPLGAAAGQGIESLSGSHPFIEPVFGALAAGTFLFLGTLHGLASSPMIVRCCNRREFTGAVAGYVLMALVAIWT